MPRRSKLRRGDSVCAALTRRHVLTLIVRLERLLHGLGRGAACHGDANLRQRVRELCGLGLLGLLEVLLHGQLAVAVVAPQPLRGLGFAGARNVAELVHDRGWAWLLLASVCR